MVLKSRVPTVDWSADGDPDREALCRKFPLPDDHDVTKDPWFHGPDMEDAAQICNGTYTGRPCPFRNFCLYRALVNNEGNGVFGGLLTVQRRWVRKNVPRDDWYYPTGDPYGREGWLHTVPPLSFFDEEEERAEEAKKQ